MSYPLSSDVSAGDPTSSAHYNNLRSDALRFGQVAADSVNIGQLFEWFESRLKLERLNTAQVRVPASSTEPVDLMVYGFPVRAVANVDLAIGDVPTGGAQTWYVFANRSASSTTFTLSINTSATENANQRRIGRFYFDGTNIVKDSVRTELSELISSLLYFKEPHICNGRLTLSTGIPIPSTDISSSAAVYFTPYKGNRVSLYVPNYGWRVYTFSEISLDISSFDAGKPYDIFLYDDTGTLTLEGVTWSNATLRATALVLQDGVYVKQNALDHLYLGTIYMTGAGTSADSLLKRCCWNNYNRVYRQFTIKELTDSWTYAVAAWRKLNNSSSNKVEFVIGLSEEPVYLLWGFSMANSAGNSACVAAGLDSESVPTPFLNGLSQGTSNQFQMGAYNGFPGIGYHYLQLLEYISAGTETFYGDAGGSNYMSGAIGWILS